MIKGSDKRAGGGIEQQAPGSYPEVVDDAASLAMISQKSPLRRWPVFMVPTPTKGKTVPSDVIRKPETYLRGSRLRACPT